MIRLFKYVRSRLGAKVIAAVIATFAIAAIAQVIVTVQFGSSLAQRAAHESSEALRAQARASLKRLTREQANRYNQIFSEVGNRTRMLAWQAGHHFTLGSASDPHFPLDLRWNPEMAFHFNGADDPISLLHWGNATVTGAVRQQMRALTHMSTPLTRAQREIQGATAAWILTEKRVGVYVPNRSGIESSAPADQAAMLDSRSYRTGHAAPGQTRWTDVYGDVAGTGPIITATTPIYGPDNETFLGVAGIDLTVRRTVNRVLTQEPLGIQPPVGADGPPAELSFLMEANTKPIALPRDQRSLLGLPAKVKSAPGETLGTPPLAEAGPADLRRAARRAVEADHLVVDDLTLNGQRYIAAFHTIPATGWVLANVVADKALLSKVAATRAEIGQRVASMTAILAAVGAGLMLLMATGLMAYFRRAVLRPLGRLAEASERMRSGQYRVGVPVRGDDELGRVGQSFNTLSDHLADVLEDLEQRVEARTRELRDARDRAAAADAAKTRFLSTMNHELRSPLNAVLGYADLIRNKTLGERTDAYAEHAQTIHDSASHLLELVEDVLAMARLEHGTYTVSPDWVDVPEVAQVCRRMIQPQADAHGAELESALPDDLPRLWADERALRQMVINLLGNAVKFAGDGGRVTLSAERTADGGLALHVTDTGPGIAPEDQARILQPFEQTDAGAGRGTGLGLAITARLMHLHDGKLRLDSAVGAGSTFTLAFPAERVADAQTAQAL